MKFSKIIGRAVYIFLCALPPTLFCFSCGAFMMPLAVAIVLHECGHLLALRMLGGRVCGIRPAPFGLCIEYDTSTLSHGGELLVGVAGCIVNVASVAVSFALYKFFAIDIINFGTVSAVLALLNLIPVNPLDGGRMLSVVTEYLFGQRVSYLVGAVCSYIFGFAVFLFASYSLLTSQNGVYPVLFSIYLFSCNAKMLENALFDEKTSI